MLPGAAIEQHDHQKAQQGEGDIAVYAKGERRVGAEPLILGHHAQCDPYSGQAVHGCGKAVLTINLIPLPPHIIEQHIKNRHRNRSDPFSQAQRNGVILQTGGTQGNGPGNQMERISRPQHDSHPSEQTELTLSFAAADH